MGAIQFYIGCYSGSVGTRAFACARTRRYIGDFQEISPKVAGPRLSEHRSTGTCFPSASVEAALGKFSVGLMMRTRCNRAEIMLLGVNCANSSVKSYVGEIVIREREGSQ